MFHLIVERKAIRLTLYAQRYREFNMPVSSLRHASAKLFGNEKLVEVVGALRSASNVATAQQIAKATGIDHAMVRVVLLRLVEASILIALPRANTRAAQYYEADDASPIWHALCSLAEALEQRTPAGQHSNQEQGAREGHAG